MHLRAYLVRATTALLLLGSLHLSAYGQRLDDGELAFDTKARVTRILRQQLLKGEIAADPKVASHLEAIEHAAKDAVYPLFWKTQRRPVSRTINDIVEGFDAELLRMTRYKAATLNMQHLYCKGVMDCVRDVMLHDKSKPIATVNAARILSRITARRNQLRDIQQTDKEWVDDVLPRLAEGNGDYLANLCVKLLEDQRVTDGARYYLFQTLAGLMGLPKQDPPLLKKDTEDKVWAVAIKQIEKPMQFPKATPKQEVEGYKMLRLQAVRTLAAAPPLGSGSLRPVFTLARVAGSDESIVPAPRLEERVEAAIGLAHMGGQVAKYPDVQMDYAMLQICRAVVDLGLQANTNLDSKRNVRLAPWKVLGARVGEALEELKTQVKDPYVQNACDQCLSRVALSLERGAAPNPNDLSDWLQNNQPTSASLLKSDDKTGIKSRPAVVEEKEE